MKAFENLELWWVTGAHLGRRECVHPSDDTHTLGVVVSGLHHSLNLFRRVGCTFIYYF